MPMELHEIKHHEPVTWEGFEFCRVTINLNKLVNIVQEFDDHGNHRLRYIPDGKEPVFTDWKTYRGLAVLQIGSIGIFVGCTEYYNGELPRVFQLINPLMIS